MKRITFKLVSTAKGRIPRRLPMVRTDRNGNQSFINTEGVLVNRAPVSANMRLGTQGDQVHILVLGSEEIHNFTEVHTDQNGKATQVNNPQPRMFYEGTYVLTEDEGKLPAEQRMMNLIVRQCHEMLKSHNEVIVRNPETKQNENPNQWGNVQFELIEESALVLKQIENSHLLTQARNIAEEMYNSEDENRFKDFCYVYGITRVEESSKEELYVQMMLKLENNPKDFHDKLKVSDDITLIAVKKAMSKVMPEDGDPHRTLISWKEGYYYYQNEIIGVDETQMVAWFNMRPKVRVALLHRLGITPPDADFVELPPATDQKPAPTVIKADRLRVEEMGKSIDKICKNIRNRKAGAKGKIETNELTAELTLQLSALKEVYMDLDDQFEAQEQYYRKKYSLV